MRMGFRLRRLCSSISRMGGPFEEIGDTAAIACKERRYDPLGHGSIQEVAAVNSSHGGGENSFSA